MMAWPANIGVPLKGSSVSGSRVSGSSCLRYTTSRAAKGSQGPTSTVHADAESATRNARVAWRPLLLARGAAGDGVGTWAEDKRAADTREERAPTAARGEDCLFMNRDIG